MLFVEVCLWHYSWFLFCILSFILCYKKSNSFAMEKYLDFKVKFLSCVIGAYYFGYLGFLGTSTLLCSSKKSKWKKLRIVKKYVYNKNVCQLNQMPQVLPCNFRVVGLVISCHVEQFLTDLSNIYFCKVVFHDTKASLHLYFRVFSLCPSVFEQDEFSGCTTLMNFQSNQC